MPALIRPRIGLSIVSWRTPCVSGGEAYAGKSCESTRLLRTERIV
jgi:hypothetical protein